MCNTSDWIHCNKNPTLHRHPQNRNQSRGCLSKLAEKEPDLNFQLLLENKEKTKVSSSPPAPSFGSPGLPSVFLKLGTRKTVVDRKTKKSPLFHLLPVLFRPHPISFFFQTETFACRCQAANTGPHGLLQWGNMRQPKSMRNVHAAKIHISTGTRMVLTGQPLGNRGEAGDAATAASRAPRPPSRCKVISNLKARREITFRRVGCVWLLCGERGCRAAAAGASEDHAGRAAALITVGLRRVVHLPHDLGEQLVHRGFVFGRSLHEGAAPLLRQGLALAE